jgi:hypothetical protein
MVLQWYASTGVLEGHWCSTSGTVVVQDYMGPGIVRGYSGSGVVQRYMCTGIAHKYRVQA